MVDLFCKKYSVTDFLYVVNMADYLFIYVCVYVCACVHVHTLQLLIYDVNIWRRMFDNTYSVSCVQQFYIQKLLKYLLHDFPY